MKSTSWAQEITNEVASEWDRIAQADPSLNCGFSVFYSPPKSKSSVLIIGFNPGGDGDSFDRQRAGLVPEVHDYFNDHDGKPYRIAWRMRDLFGENETLLRESVKTNIIFFRSRSAADWETIKKKVKEDLEEKCRGWVRRVIEEMKPKYILAEGLRTFEAMIQSFGPSLSSEATDTTYSNNGRSRIFTRSIIQVDSLVVPISGIAHPSGARISKSSWNTMKELLAQDLERLKSSGVSDASNL